MRMLAFCGLALLAATSVPANACSLVGSESATVLKRPVDGLILSGFGMRRHPLLQITKMHTGTDWGAEPGAPVHASAAGEVVKTGAEGEYGNLILIRHGGGLETAYAHLSQIGVKEGDCVAQGSVIGGVGSTGLSSGPALHFEVRRNGQFVDPLMALAESHESGAR